MTRMLWEKKKILDVNLNYYIEISLNSGITWQVCASSFVSDWVKDS